MGIAGKYIKIMGKNKGMRGKYLEITNKYQRITSRCKAKMVRIRV